MSDTPPDDDSIVSQAKGAMAGFFSQTIQALGDDMKTRLEANNPPPGASNLRDATTAFTTEMIKLLAARIKDVLPDSAGGNKKTGGS
jgi:hypothetical protein